MAPDRTNYEIWLIDYLDGNLDPGQIGELMAFLDQNPDIKEEFNEITKYNIRPADFTFRHKNSLKRSASEISMLQFEYLCVAALENDLTDSQVTEVEGIITGNPEKRKIYELFRKSKLAAPKISYSNKYKLKKQTAVQRIIRFSIIGLSAAATVAVTILLYNVATKKNVGEGDLAVLNFKDTITIMTNQVKLAVKETPEEKRAAEKLPASTFPSAQNSGPAVKESDRSVSIVSDSTVGKSTLRPVSLSKIAYKGSMSFSELSYTSALAQMKMAVIDSSETSESHGFNGFIARTFREKILKTIGQEKGNLKAYEIADAGILGLNKLFGWNMSLRKNKNEKGEIKSFYFSSKLLKFNVPVKKTASLP